MVKMLHLWLGQPGTAVMAPVPGRFVWGWCSPFQIFNQFVKSSRFSVTVSLPEPESRQRRNLDNDRLVLPEWHILQGFPL